MKLKSAPHLRRTTRVSLVVLAALLLAAVATLTVLDSPRSWTEDVLPGPSVGPESVDVAGTSQDRLCGVDGVDVFAPASSFASTVADNPPGTCFRLNPGTYRFGNVVPKDGMSFLGTSAADVILNGNGHENAFHGTADSVTIANMTFAGFNGDGGTKRQEQAPIRGTRAIWASTRGTMATNWTIDSIISRDNFASGLFLGDNFHVLNSEFHSNGTTGIAGNEIVGGIIENNLIYGNGVHAATGALENGGGLKVTQAGTLNEPMIVRYNEVFDNRDIGIWCDIACRGFHVIDNHIHDHRSAGISIELSSGALIEGNRIERSSTWTDFSIDWNAGAVTIAESANSVVRNNYIADSKGGVIVRQTLRPARPIENFLDNYEFVTFVVDNVTVENNIIVDVELMGYTTGRTGQGLAPNPQSIRFNGNLYNNPQQVSFAHGEGRFGYNGWVAAGRDSSQGGTLPPASSYGVNAGTTQSSSGSSTDNGSTVVPETPRSPDPTPSTGATAPSTLPLRINAGGPTVVVDGVTWSSDQFFDGGDSAVRDGVAVASTSLDPIYQSERWGVNDYAIPVPNGTYQVILHHSEMYDGCQQASCRVFDVAVEGESAASDLDIYAEVGGRTALTTTLTVDVDDDVLDIQFDRVVQEPQISGIEILPGFNQAAPNGDRASNDAITPPAAESSDDSNTPAPSQSGSNSSGNDNGSGTGTSAPPSSGDTTTTPNPSSSSGEAAEQTGSDDESSALQPASGNEQTPSTVNPDESATTTKEAARQADDFGVGDEATEGRPADELALKETNPAGLQKFSTGEMAGIGLLLVALSAAIIGIGMAFSRRSGA